MKRLLLTALLLSGCGVTAATQAPSEEPVATLRNVVQPRLGHFDCYEPGGKPARQDVSTSALMLVFDGGQPGLHSVWRRAENNDLPTACVERRFGIPGLTR